MVKKYTAFALLIVLCASCATTKSRNDQSKLAQFYHNLTSKFNGYFNANELLKESVLTLEQAHADNYNELLPIHKYTAVDNADAVKSNLDEAIKKVSVVVTLHEYSDFADDCYLLIGKSHYLKQDYESAQNALEFYFDEFKPNGKRINIKPKKKKKKSPVKRGSKNSSKKSKKSSAKSSRASKAAAKERQRYNKQLRKIQKKRKKNKGKKKKVSRVEPKVAAADSTSQIKTADNAPAKDVSAPKSTEKKLAVEKEKPEKPEEKMTGMLGHKPAFQGAILWLARTYIARDNYIAADFQLVKLEKMPDLLDDVATELPVIRAEYYINRQNYEGAIERLKNAIELAKKKKERARYTYIIAQLYEQLNQTDKAAEMYQAVIKMNPSYEMEFNARLKSLINGMNNGLMTSAEAEKRLDKMIKDFKNEEYLDQLYFAIAKIAIEENDIPKAIENLELSVLSPGVNPAQKTESNYLLAELQFNRGEYIAAKGAFDAALGTMSEEDDRYDYAKLMSENLTDIAKHLEVITEKDSLIRIAALSESEQEAIAKAIIKAREDAVNNPGPSGLAKSQGKSGGMNPNAQRSGIPSVRNASNVSQSSFFAFDNKTVKKGEKEFSRTWGDIPLGNNWRVRSIAASVSQEELGDDGLIVEEIVSGSEIENLLKNVPSTPEELEAAHTEIRKAMLALGRLYRERLENYNSSSEVLEKLLSLYPEAPERMETYYELYLTYLSMGNDAKANEYKDRLIKEFSTSKYAKALSDPDYAKNQLTERQKMVQFYDGAYASFEAGDYKSTKEKLDQVPTLFGQSNPMSSKFALLSALNTGALDGQEAYINALKQIIAKFPRTDEEKKARDILLVLGATASGKTFGAKNLNVANFIADPEKPHFMLVFVKNQDQVELRDAKIAIANYNRKYHNLDKLRITSLIFNPQTRESIILLRSFSNKAKAMDYYSGVMRKATEFLPEDADYVAYPITQNNYREIIKARSIDDYEAFFQEQYQ